MKLKTKTVDWSHCYQKALRRFLFQEASSSFKPACKLGAQAAALGMETLELAQIHKRVLNDILSQEATSVAQNKIILKAKSFFNETNSSIEKTHAVTLTKKERVKQLAQELIKLTAESKALHQRLAKGIVNRKMAEAALVKSHADQAKLMQTSKRLRVLLRNQNHAIILKQEKERKKSSRGLQNKIAQDLLGINIELLALKASDTDCATRFLKEIDSIKKCVRLNPGII